jgi:4-amino-4-deoxy-L-arabinose transferase-like glycosyltransferase
MSKISADIPPPSNRTSNNAAPELLATNLQATQAPKMKQEFNHHASLINRHFSTVSRHRILLTSLLLILLASFLFFYRLDDRDLWSSHEARAAQDAQTVLEDGQWGLPRLFDRKYVELQKPPLYYWLVAGIAGLKGGLVNEWAVRLPSALAALGCILLLFYFGIHLGRLTAALAAALFLATAVHFTWLARIGRIDIPLTFAISFALVCLYFSRTKNSWCWLLAAYCSLSAAVLLKGPIGLVLPGVAITGWLLLEGELPRPWRPRSWLALAHRFGLWWGIPLVMLIAGPWFIWAASQTNGALEKSLWYHNVVRAIGGTDGMRARPPLFYIPRLAVDFFPWSLLLPFAFWYMMRCKLWRLDSEARFGLVWLISMMAVLSCVGFKRADYLLPAYPGAAIFLGCVVERWLQTVRHPARLAGAFGMVVVFCLIGWWIHLTWILPKGEKEREDRTFAAAIRRYAPPPDPVIFFRVEEHALAFHVGRPLDTLLEWENLDFWVGQPRPFYVVMDAKCAQEWPDHLQSGLLQPVIGNVELAGGKHEHPLLLFRTRPLEKNGLQLSSAIPYKGCRGK